MPVPSIAQTRHSAGGGAILLRCIAPGDQRSEIGSQPCNATPYVTISLANRCPQKKRHQEKCSKRPNFLACNARPQTSDLFAIATVCNRTSARAHLRFIDLLPNKYWAYRRPACTAKRVAYTTDDLIVASTDAVITEQARTPIRPVFMPKSI